jgi:hypothetical protein
LLAAFRWNDALCIDQENIPERNQQVQIMRDIYHEAEKVLIWLGEEENDSDLAMDFIGDVVDVILALPSGALLTFINITDYGLPPHPDKHWFALGKLLTRPWFQRVWVVQECIMAKDAVVLCGGRELPWSSLEMLIVEPNNWPYATQPILQSSVIQSNLLGPLGRTALKQVPGIVREKALLKRTHKLFDMVDILRAYQDCLATDPIDKVFAFLGCVPIETAAQYLPPDYGRSVKDVYMEIASIALLKFSNLNILSDAGCGQQQRQHDIPSWVPEPTHLSLQPLGLTGAKFRRRSSQWYQSTVPARILAPSLN